MKLTNKKKGFTIVELVIVIAVIAILAAVLIPNLSRLVTKANESAAMQEAEAALKLDLIKARGDYTNIGSNDSNLVDAEGDFVGEYKAKTGENAKGGEITYKVKNNTYTCIFDTETGTWTTTKSGS